MTRTRNKNEQSLSIFLCPNVFKPAELIAEVALEQMQSYEEFEQRVLHCIETRKERPDPYSMRTEKHGVLKFTER